MTGLNTIKPAASSRPRFASQKTCRTFGGAGREFRSGVGNAWSLSLDLVCAGNRHCGRLTMYRCYTTRDLQLDVNLLTSGFALTLAEAVQRTAVQNVEFIPTQDPGLLAAQAG
jgi:hypothetical protein